MNSVNNKHKDITKWRNVNSGKSHFTNIYYKKAQLTQREARDSLGI